MYLIFTTDHHHAHASKQLIGLATSKRYVVSIINEYCDQQEQKKLTEQDTMQLEHYSQTQSQEGRSVEFVVEELEVNTLL